MMIGYSQLLITKAKIIEKNKIYFITKTYMV